MPTPVASPVVLALSGRAGQAALVRGSVSLMIITYVI